MEIPILEELIKEYPNIDRIVISGYWLQYYSASKFIYHGVPITEESRRKASIQAFGNMIAGLVAKGKKVTVLLNIPIGKELNPRHFYRSHFFVPIEYGPQLLTKEAFQKKSASLMEEITNAAKANGDSIFSLVLRKNFCASNAPFSI